MNSLGSVVLRLARSLLQSPRRFRRVFGNVPSIIAGQRYAAAYVDHGGDRPGAGEPSSSPLENFFDAHRSGPGIWKWRHYFDIYHRHLAKFRGRDVQFAEIGVFSGGSLQMWGSYFGSGSHIHGVDLDDATRAYQAGNVTIHVGDQEDREFWARFRRDVPLLDVIVDDGGHTPQQQRVTLEEMLPHLRAGGVYICEDIHSTDNEFTAYIAGLVDQMNAFDSGSPVRVSAFQSAVASIHAYPFVVVIEKHEHPPIHLISERRGSEWQPPTVHRDGYGKLRGRGD